MFLTDDQLGGFLMDMLQSDSLQTWQLSIVSAANIAAYQDILNAFVLRGFTQATVNQLDRGAEFERAIGLWYCLQEMARRAPDLYSQKALKETDRRPELKKLALLIGGVFQNPTTPVGNPVIGRRNGWDEFGPCRWPRGV